MKINTNIGARVRKINNEVSQSIRPQGNGGKANDHEQVRADFKKQRESNITTLGKSNGAKGGNV